MLRNPEMSGSTFSRATGSTGSTATATRKLLMQDAFKITDSACVLYPTAPECFEAASHGDEGRMDSLIEAIRTAIGERTLATSKDGDRVNPDDLIRWAKKRRLIEPDLAKAIHRLLSEKKNHSGSELWSLRADKEILSAAVALLAVRLGQRGKRVRGGALCSAIEEQADVFWADGQLPKGTRAVVIF